MKSTIQIYYHQLKKGETIGHILLMKSDVNIGSFEVTINQDIEALTLPEKMYNYLKAFI